MASGAQTRPLLTILAQWARVPADDHHRYISDRRRVPTQLPEALRAEALLFKSREETVPPEAGASPQPQAHP